jgi:hypothetical protein
VRPGVVCASLRDVEKTLDADEREILREIYDQAVSILQFSPPFAFLL